MGNHSNKNVNNKCQIFRVKQSESKKALSTKEKNYTFYKLALKVHKAYIPIVNKV